MVQAKRLEKIRSFTYELEEFLKEIGMSRTTYWRKLKGKTEFTVSEIRSIGRVLALSVSELVEIFDLK